MVKQTRPEFLFLQQEDVIEAGGLDMGMVLERTEKTFRMFGSDELIQPVKPMIMLPDAYNRRYLMVAMPVMMKGDVNQAGIKWAAESKDNAERGDLPYGIDVILLHDVERAIPLAIMDGSLITAMRTGAAAGVAAKYLAREDSEVVGLVGAGVIGRTALEAIGLSVPNVKEFRIFDLNPEKSRRLQKDFSDRWNIVIADSLESALSEADIISTQTTTTSPFIKAEWVRKGTFFAQVGANEAEPEVHLQADHVVVDEIEMVKRYESVPHRLMVEGKLLEENMAHLSDVLLGKAAGRTADSDRVVFLSHGMGSLDINVASAIYENARDRGLGQTLALWDKTVLELG
ncbi:MAG: ornithine cyclodeaminase family protein [Anaerolineales bacterium]|nr:ornithine cyclodeaminase family protein [Anaerolineales bacterium]